MSNNRGSCFYPCHFYHDQDHGGIVCSSERYPRTNGCIRFIDYFDCYAGDSAVRAFPFGIIASSFVLGGRNVPAFGGKYLDDSFSVDATEIPRKIYKIATTIFSPLILSIFLPRKKVGYPRACIRTCQEFFDDTHGTFQLFTMLRFHDRPVCKRRGVASLSHPITIRRCYRGFTSLWPRRDSKVSTPLLRARQNGLCVRRVFRIPTSTTTRLLLAL